MKKLISLFLITVICLGLFGCSGGSASDEHEGTTDDMSAEFTNNYGTANTVCARVNCKNLIARSGDTNCCAIHSSRCSDCGCYIDNGALKCTLCRTGTAVTAPPTEAEESTTPAAETPSSADEAATESTTVPTTEPATSVSFTNKYGTPTTKCAKSGCNSYIAKSGDTNCCTSHSNRCLNCSCYIDGDAMYCMTCLTGSYTGGSDHHEDEHHGSSSGSFTNKYGTPTTKCVKSGCNNYIAKSGDTNCCTSHSNRCLNCSCYIDGDAMYCMTCLTGGLY